MKMEVLVYLTLNPHDPWESEQLSLAILERISENCRGHRQPWLHLRKYYCANFKPWPAKRKAFPNSIYYVNPVSVIVAILRFWFFIILLSNRFNFITSKIKEINCDLNSRLHFYMHKEKIALVMYSRILAIGKKKANSCNRSFSFIFKLNV